jgi:hypothetical protein
VCRRLTSQKSLLSLINAACIKVPILGIFDCFKVLLEPKLLFNSHFL